ncbi:DUF6508 domain-containing protein [Brevundimonas sp. GCM10030266]|uniref:DUF6508 domain-containing protein n=1 Tax=Brevundimonas sp. GCM10030266 TaxID=3273386 RepID=UPI003609A7B6
MSSSELTTLAAALDATPSDTFMRWDGSLPVYAPILDQWTSALSERGYGGASPFYDRLLSRDAPPLNPENIATADADALVGYATFILRGERFCYGHIGGCHAQGLLAAVARRFAEIESA